MRAAEEVSGLDGVFLIGGGELSGLKTLSLIARERVAFGFLDSMSVWACERVAGHRPSTVPADRFVTSGLFQPHLEARKMTAVKERPGRLHLALIWAEVVTWERVSAGIAARCGPSRSPAHAAQNRTTSRRHPGASGRLRP
jgi:hypothetical protein